MPHVHHHKRDANPDFGGDFLSVIAAPFTELASEIEGGSGNGNGGNGKGNSGKGVQLATITSYVYVTSGSATAYTTLSPSQAAPSPPADQSSLSSTHKGSSSPQSSTGLDSSLPSSVVPTASVHSTVPVTSSMRITSTPTPTNALATAATVAAASATSILPDASTSSGDMTTGAKAGLAIGIILIIGAIVSVIFFCIRQRRKKAEHQRLEDEKFNEQNDIFAANRAPSVRSVKTLSTAPRLSLRPVTQFSPGLADNRNGPSAARSGPTQSAWERPMIGNDQNKENPFGNHAEAVDPVNAAGPSVIQATGPGGEVMAGTAAAGAVVGLARGASKRGNGPKPLDFTQKLPDIGQPSPSGTEFSFSEAPATPTQTPGAAAIAAAGGPQNAMVHRVQLDFKPSMDDELEIHAGQLVRILHEYDDGWALCIRLDRSQQGVVPRTCLSVRPVKPRLPQGGPRGPPPGKRGPQGQQGRPMSPAMNGPQRPASPAGGPPMGGPRYNPQDRPSSPAGRPMNPNQQVQSKSPSPSQMQSRRLTPPGPSGMNSNGSTPSQGSPPREFTRKPVPGQAM